MNCKEIQGKLNGYLDKELYGSLQEKVKQHLEQCSACQKKYDDLQQLVSQISDLPRAINPDENLWPKISSKINAGRRNKILNLFNQYKSYLSVAAVVLFLIGSLFLTLKDEKGQINNVTKQISPHLQSAIQLIKKEYSQTREMVQLALSSSQGELSAETIRTIEYNLQIIDEATKNIHNALQENGADRELLELYYQSYINQVNLLQQTLKLLNKQKRRKI